MFYRKTVLDNGITVMSEPMDSVRSIALGIWFAVGSRDESRRRGRHVALHGAHDVQGHADAQRPGHLRAVRPPRRRTQRLHLEGVHLLLQPLRRREPLHRVRDPLGHGASTRNLDDGACELEREVVIERDRRAWRTRPTTTSTRSSATRCGPTTRSACRSWAAARPWATFDHAQSVAFRAQALPDRQLRRRGGGQRRPRRARRARREVAGRARPRPALGAPGCRRDRRRQARRPREGHRAGAHLLRRRHDERAPPRPLRALDPRRRARRRHELAPVPGDPREARAGLRRLPLLGALPGHRRVRGLRRHASRQRRGGHQAHPAPRSSASRSTASPPTSSTACARRPRATSCWAWSRPAIA